MSCGVAVLARHGIGLVDAEVVTSQPHRLVGAFVEVPGMRRFLLTSAYGAQKLELSEGNADLLADGLAAFAGARVHGWMGGDWNFEPDSVHSCGMLTKANACLVAPFRPDVHRGQRIKDHRLLHSRGWC